jgi:hypothetical protein
VAIQAETLMPPLAEEELVEALVEVEEDAPSRFKITCSLLLTFRLNATVCGLDPRLSALIETCSSPLLFGLPMLIGDCSE